jgi:prepilin-type N-terminal cleavage/methylation domain-containing protein
MIQRSLAKKRSGEGGFTLVELLIVIVILGILAAIVVLAIGGLSGSAQTATCKSGAKTIESAEDAYYASVTPPTYGSLAQLETAGLLKQPATQIPFTATGTGAGYTITGINQAGGSDCTGTNITFP